MTGRADQPTHFSPAESHQIGQLLEAGVTMLRCEDAYHVGLLSHHHDSDEVRELGELRRLARDRFRQLLNTVADSFDALA